MKCSDTYIYLVRHGQASARFDEAYDPGLDEVGLAQALAIAKELTPLGPLPVLTSPLLRARQTASAFEDCWSVHAQVETALSEIPSPNQNLTSRAAWLQQAMQGSWDEMSGEHQKWRERVAAVLGAFKETTVVTSHFIAINAAVGIATKDDRVVCFEPDNCSCTRLRVIPGGLELLELGRERVTRVT